MKLIRNLRKLVKTSALAAFLAFGTSVQAAEEWPQWRGPKGDGIVREAGLLEKWPEGGPKKVWSVPVGLGYSSPIGFQGKVYLFHHEGQDKEVLTAFDPATGKVVWSEGYDRPLVKGKRPTPTWEGTRATPTIHDGKIYTNGSTGLLVARNLTDGKELWRLDVLKETGGALLGDNQEWAQSSSPLVHGDHLYVQGGKGGAVAVAVDKNTGKLAWKAEPAGLSGYGSPVLAEVQGKPQLIIFGGDNLYGLDPQTGKKLWEQPWKTQYDINAITPLVHEGQVFIASGYTPRTGGSALFQLTPTGANKVWEKLGTKGLAARFQPPILDNGFVYGVSEERRGRIKCQKWATGEIVWDADEPKGLGFGGSMVRAGDKLIAMTQTGTLYLVRATPEKAEVLSEAVVFPGNFDQIWATPLVYQGKLYAKGKDQLVCLDISGK